MKIEEIKNKKKEIRKRDKEFRTCFWTRPWGHYWIQDRTYRSYIRTRYICNICGKTKITSGIGF